ncbi:MAG: ribonuclease P protein component [Alphaproteobacteria bacterium]|nr:ribonuclease P protein component [Alphaproteobacteria bacterium]
MKRNTIKKHDDFKMTDANPSARSLFFTVRAKPTLFPGDARYGVVAIKRIFRLAIRRNRAKRLLRDWIAPFESMLSPGMDYVFIARPEILTASRDEGRWAMYKALRYILKHDWGTGNAA